MANAVMENTAGPAGWMVPAPRQEPTGDEWLWEDEAEEPQRVLLMAPCSEPEQIVVTTVTPPPEPPEVPEPVRGRHAAPEAVGAEPVVDEPAGGVRTAPTVPKQPGPVDGPVLVPLDVPEARHRCGFTFLTLPSTPRWARALVREELRGWGMESYADTVELLVSELLTNAVNAGGSEAIVRVTAEARRLRIEVADGGDGRPSVADPGPDSEDGHGLVVVAGVSAEWGTYPVRAESGTAIGKVVWCEIPADEPEATVTGTRA